MIQLVVLDFDGVIIDSNQPKVDAYYRIFHNKEESVVTEILRTDREKSRYKIIKMVLTRIHAQDEVSREIDPAQIEAYAEKYNSLVESMAKTCPEVEGADRMLESLAGQYTLYLNSATPQEPLERIVEARNLRHFFKGVYGTTGSKTEKLQEIMDIEQIPGSKIVVVGDGRSDMISAEACGCCFIGICNAFNSFDNKINATDKLVDVPLMIATLGAQ